MSRFAYTARIALASLAALGTVVVLLLVWELRPAIPHFTQSGRGAGMVPTLRQTGVDLGWLLTVGLLISLMARAVAVITSLERPRHWKATARLQETLAIEPRRGLPVRQIPHRERIRPYPLVVHAADRALAETTSEPSREVRESVKNAPTSRVADRSISLLGPLTIEGARQRGRGIRSLTSELLVYLALHPEGGTVEALADALLPNTDFEKARGRIWQSATEAKRILGDSFQRNRNGCYQLDRGTTAIDLDELQDLLHASQSAADPDAETDLLEQALSLFRGEPLADADFAWADGHARQLRATYVDLLQRAGRTRLEAGDARGAIDAAERGIHLDQLNEDLWRLAMQADYQLGLRDSVNNRYEQLRTLLNSELGLEPSSETRHLCLDLLGQRTSQP